MELSITLTGKAALEYMMWLSEKQIREQTSKKNSRPETVLAEAEVEPKAEKDSPQWDDSTQTAQTHRYTYESARAKLAEIIRAGKKDEVKQLLNSKGYDALSEVPIEKLDALMAEAEAI